MTGGTDKPAREDEDHENQADDGDEAADESIPADPLAPGRSLFDEGDDAVEPNEPA